MTASVAPSLSALPPLLPSHSHGSNDTPIDGGNACGDSGIKSPSRSPYTSSSFETNTSSSSVLQSKTHFQTIGEIGDQTNDVQETGTPENHVQAKPSPKRPLRLARLEDFELIRVLGKGCAGRVLLVRETETAKVLAMKAISKRSVLAHDELNHTLTEARILRNFAIHEAENPFVSKLHHSFTDRENFYFVMDFYPGGDLATQMEIHGILGVHRTRFYAADLVQGLEDLHRNGIIMRDLKPENVLLNARGHAVLADFGLSKDFGYRGEPKPLHVVTYPGQPVLPEWAGKGAASLRRMENGTKKLVVDRGYSFVGTAEYLAPEVVKRGEYSYAVDWWALGCIVLEGIIGKSPFRKEDHEPLIILWNRILHDDWDAIFLDPCMRGRRPADYNLDHVTWDFIDALLIKDPMWRLTEPCVKSHPYFQHIDWETVRKSEYDDPHDLHLHDISEYNTYYFPKLCLDEEPTVDMTSHDVEHRDGSLDKQTLMTDNALYMLEQAKYKVELEAFTWSREMELAERNSHEVFADLTSEAPPAVPVQTPKVETGQPKNTGVEAQRENLLDDSFGIEQLLRNGVVDKELSQTPSPPQSPPSPQTPERWLMEAAQVPLPSPSVLRPSAPPTPPITDLRLRSNKQADSPAGTTTSKPIPVSPKRHLIRHDRDGNLPTHPPASGLSVSDIVSVASLGDGSPSRIVRRHKAMPSVDSTPASRLSVDLNGTITDLGDDDWEQLGNASEFDSLPNAPRAAGASFFHRVLKRSPSTLVGSGLRRQAKRSDVSETSSLSPNNISPAKKGPLSLLIKGGGTRRALDKIKTFPVLRKSDNSPPSSYHPPHPHMIEDKLGEVRPDTNRRHTESGWSERKPSGSRTLNRSETNLSVPRTGSLGTTGRSFSAGMDAHSDNDQDKGRGLLTMGRSFSEIVRGGREKVPPVGAGKKHEEAVLGLPPRVKLKETPPVVWELDGEK